MSGTVSNLGDARRKKKSQGAAPSSTNLTCPGCGKDRFMATVFVQRLRSGEPGDVVGYLHPLRCVNCGRAQGEDGA